MLSGCIKHKSEQRSSINYMIRCLRKYQSAFSFSWLTLFINQQNYMSAHERSNLGLPGTINSLRLTRRNEMSRWLQLSNRIEFIKRKSEKSVKARMRKQLLQQRLKEINKKTQVQRQFNQAVIKEIRQLTLKDSRNKLIKMKDTQLQSLSRSRENTLRRNLQAALVVRQDSFHLREQLASQNKSSFQEKKNKRRRILTEQSQCKLAIQSYYQSKRRVARQKRINSAYKQSQWNKKLQRRNTKLQRQLFLLQNSLNII